MKVSQHFASGRVCVCQRCELVGESSWDNRFAMTSDGFFCLVCLLGGSFDRTGTWHPEEAA